MKTCLNRFTPPFLTALLWTLVSQLPIWAQEAAPVVPDLDPQLTEGAQQVNEMVDRFGLGDIPFAAFLISLAATFLLVFLAYFVVFGILRSIFRNFKSDLPLVALGASRTPATWVLFVLGCNEWQDPKVWFDKDYTVKFYIDDVALEHGQRGDRIKSEVRREIIWHLRKAYLLN